MKERVAYKKFMILQQILNSKTERLCKKVIDAQKKMGYKQCWYSEIEEDAKRYDIELNAVTKMKKSDWKKMIKIQLKKDIEKQTMKIEKTSSKMRHQKNQKYD